jgi:Tfp pilus assembly PilM family ATPase
MAQKFVGVDLGNRKVKIAVVTAGLRGAQVMHVWEQEIAKSDRRGERGEKGEKGEKGDTPDSLDAALDTALRMIKERGLGHLPTGVALPGDAGSYRVLSFPFDDPRQIAQTINFELEGQFPVPIEELVTDHLTIKRGDGRGRALVVAVKRSAIERVIARLQLADVDLKLVTTGALGIAQAMATTPILPLPPGTDASLQPVTLVVDFGHKSTELVALASDGPIAARSMRRGGRQIVRELQRTWRLDQEAAELALERDGSVDDPMVRRALQPFLREIEHTRQWLRSEFNCLAVELRVCGGVAGLRGLVEWLAQETKLPTAAVAPKESGALRAVQGRDWTHSIVALGAAIATGRRPLIQLHDAYEAGNGEGLWFQQHFSTVAALGIAILAFAGVDTMVRVQAAQRERSAYASELEAETTKVFGQSLSSAQAIRAKLSEAEGGGSSKAIPERGALEVLELVTRAATPKGGPVAAPTSSRPLPPGYTNSVDAKGAPVVLGPDGGPVPLDSSGVPMIPIADDEGEDEDSGEGPAAGPNPISDTKAGILVDDELLFSSVEIRALKIELSMTATRATAQDRLGVKLGEFACIGRITKGSIKERNERQAFDMSIDHSCFTGSVAQEGASEDGED